MTVRSTAVVAMVLVLAACGGGALPTGGQPTQGPGGSSPPTGGATTPGATATPGGTAAAGDAITAEDVRAALDALEALDSWRFTSKYWTGYAGTGSEQSVQGTERRQPEVATDAAHHSAISDVHYTRIGDDIWVNLGTPDVFYHYDAATSANLISQYEPLYIETLVAQAAGITREYEPIGVETVNGVQAMHYGLSEADRQQLVERSGLDPDHWAADVWIATNGGYLVKLSWGPQNVEDAQPVLGFNYDTLEVNCDCPINPPTNVASP
jgi:hypothetical protein